MVCSRNFFPPSLRFRSTAKIISFVRVKSKKFLKDFRKTFFAHPSLRTAFFCISRKRCMSLKKWRRKNSDIYVYFYPPFKSPIFPSFLFFAKKKKKVFRLEISIISWIAIKFSRQASAIFENFKPVFLFARWKERIAKL